MLASDGEDQRQLALSLRKANLARLLRRPIPGIFIAEYEQGDIGRDLFRVACNMGLEGIVSKRRCRALDGPPPQSMTHSGSRLYRPARIGNFDGAGRCWPQTGISQWFDVSQTRPMILWTIY
jgi:hypothetical protein